MEIIVQNRNVFFAAGIVIGVSLLINLHGARKAKKEAGKFLRNYPSAAKVYIKFKTTGIISHKITVCSVNSNKPFLFNEGLKHGFYVEPGEAKIELSYANERPGFLHKKVIKATDKVTKTLKISPYRSYILSFDTKEEDFILKEF